MTVHNGRHTRQTRISMPAISFTVWAHTARLPPTPTSPPCLFRQIRGQTGVVSASPFSQNCVAPFPAKATSAQAGKAATATARHLSSTATMKLGIRRKKPKTAPPCNNSIRHWHNPCLSKIRFQTAFKTHKAMPPTLRQPRPLTRCRRARRHHRHAVRLRQADIGQNYRLDNIPALTCPMPTSIRHTARADWRQPPSAPPPLQPKYSACRIRYRKG